MNLNKKQIKWVILTTLFIVILLFSTKSIIDYLVMDTQSLNIGTFDLPGNYVLNKISTNDNVIEHNTDGIVVSDNVTYITYNESYIFYRCSGDDGYYGLINIDSRENTKIDPDDPILVEIGLDKKMLIDVKDLYPETNKSN